MRASVDRVRLCVVNRGSYGTAGNPFLFLFIMDSHLSSLPSIACLLNIHANSPVMRLRRAPSPSLVRRWSRSLAHVAAKRSLCDVAVQLPTLPDAAPLQAQHSSAIESVQLQSGTASSQRHSISNPKVTLLGLWRTIRSLSASREQMKSLRCRLRRCLRSE
jgi:hypothetical protein